MMTMAQDGLRSGLDVTDFNQTVRPTSMPVADG